MFWTAKTLLGPSLLCERCALLALNMAAFGYVRRPFGSVQEGLDYINSRCAELDIEPMELSQSPFGVCAHCGEDVLETVEAS